MRRQTRWVFGVLAVVFAASFIFLGVGSGSSALTDFLNGNIHIFGGSSGPSVKGLQQKVAKDPTNAKLRLQLAQLLVQKSQTDEAVAAYKSYLKLKPGNTDGLQGLANAYQTKIAALQSEIQTPPDPALSILSSFQPIDQSTVLGSALTGLQPPELGSASLQQGEADQFRQQLHNVVNEHIGIYRTLAAKTPGDSSAFLQIASTAGQDGDTATAIATYQEFLKKYPTDPLVPDVKRQIATLKKSLASRQPSSSGATGQTG
jgi:tetratricopeptide (TPR) repeat protein